MSLLPQTAPPQTEPFGEIEFGADGKPTGKIIVGINWYLFLYNLSKQTLSAPGGPVPVPPAVLISLPNEDLVPPNPVTPNTLIWLGAV